MTRLSSQVTKTLVAAGFAQTARTGDRSYTRGFQVGDLEKDLVAVVGRVGPDHAPRVSFAADEGLAREYAAVLAARGFGVLVEGARVLVTTVGHAVASVGPTYRVSRSEGSR